MLSFRTLNPLLAILLTTSTVVTVALIWFGVRNLEQTSSLERQQAREQLERGADAFAASVRGKLAEAGERLSGWISTTNSRPLGLDEVVAVVSAEGRIQVFPQGALPFIPGDIRLQLPEKVFAQAEAIEIASSRPEQAAEMYRALSRSRDSHIRAEAMLRLGRVQRKERKLKEAAETYQSLGQMSDAMVEGLPAELVALDGQRSTKAAAGDRASEQRISAQIARFIDEGHWPLTWGSAEFYRDGVSNVPMPDSWLLAEAARRLRAIEGNEHPFASNLQVFETDGRTVLAIWRSNGPRSAAVLSFAEHFLASHVPVGYSYQLTDASGQRIARSTNASRLSRL